VTPPIPSCEPESFAAGETVQWTKSVPDYPNTDGWSLIYSIRGPSSFKDVTADPLSDGSYSITLAAADTDPLKPGTYQWVSRAYKAGPPVLRYAVGSGVIRVSQNLANVDTLESHAAIMVRLLEALLEGRVTSDMQRYTIAGRSIDKIPITEARQLLAAYRSELWRERHKNRANPTRAVAFVEPS